MKTLVALALLFLLVGCSNTAFIRVVEYSGGGMAGAVTGAAGGCSVYQGNGSGAFAKVNILYSGEKCVAVIEVTEREKQIP